MNEQELITASTAMEYLHISPVSAGKRYGTLAKCLEALGLQVVARYPQPSGRGFVTYYDRDAVLRAVPSAMDMVKRWREDGLAAHRAAAEKGRAAVAANRKAREDALLTRREALVMELVGRLSTLEKDVAWLKERLSRALGTESS